MSTNGEEKILHAFGGGSDGYLPFGAALIGDAAGDLYGTTAFGGGKGCDTGCGTVFKIAPNGTETILHVFAGSDGAVPKSALVMDKKGNLYGTASEGGSGANCNGGCGTIFELTKSGKEKVLYDFAGGSDGGLPRADVLRDEAGNLYGSTWSGGGTGCSANMGCGTVYKLAPDGTETVLYAFTGGSDGAHPFAVIKDKAGDFYGTAIYGGNPACGGGCGVVFEIGTDGSETTLYSFTGKEDGAEPDGIIMDKSGNLIGTADIGGDLKCEHGQGCGVVFNLAYDGTETILKALRGKAYGAYVQSGVIEDGAGNLYGTTYWGGDTNCGQRDARARASGCGVVFKLSQ